LRQTGSTAGPVPFTKQWWARAGSGTGAPAVAPSARLSRPRAVAPPACHPPGMRVTAADRTSADRPRVVLSDTREVAGSNQSCPRSRQPGRTRTRTPHSPPGRTQVPRIRARYAGSARRRVRCTISDGARLTPPAREPARLPRRTPRYSWRSQRYPCPRIVLPGRPQRRHRCCVPTELAACVQQRDERGDAGGKGRRAEVLRGWIAMGSRREPAPRRVRGVRESERWRMGRIVSPRRA
jgi:hypothetical protein